MYTSQYQRPKYENPAFPLLIKQGTFGESSSGWHEDIEIKLIRSDKLYITSDANLFCGQKDEFFFINPYQVHTSPNTFGNINEYALIMICPDFFYTTGVHALSLRKLFMEDQIRLNNHIKNPYLTEILNKIIDIYEQRHDPFVRVLIQAYLMEFFSIMFLEEVATTNKNNTFDNFRHYQSIVPALEAIHKNYDRRLSSKSLAQECQLSQGYFCRLFKQVMGTTPIDYQLQHCLTLADLLLKEGKHTIAEIAHLIGFEDENYFSRCYKKYRGISPIKTRKNKDL